MSPVAEMRGRSKGDVDAELFSSGADGSDRRLRPSCVARGRQRVRRGREEAAYYSDDYKGVTASGVQYDPLKFTCAHRTLPFDTKLRVTDMRTQRSVVVVVNDRGPFNTGRVLDLSKAAAKALTGRGLIKVTATVE